MPRSTLFGSGSSAQQEDHWIPLSDLMTGSMMVFLLIAIFLWLNRGAIKANKKHCSCYDAMKNSLYRDLLEEFKDDLPRWKAELDPDLTIRFVEPSVLFDSGKADIKPEFARIHEFIPQYIGILSARYSGSIEELRIEGHTSSFWADLPRDAAYFSNNGNYLRAVPVVYWPTFLIWKACGVSAIG